MFLESPGDKGSGPALPYLGGGPLCAPGGASTHQCLSSWSRSLAPESPAEPLKILGPGPHPQRSPARIGGGGAVIGILKCSPGTAVVWAGGDPLALIETSEKLEPHLGMLTTKKQRDS